MPHRYIVHSMHRTPSGLGEQINPQFNANIKCVYNIFTEPNILSHHYAAAAAAAAADVHAMAPYSTKRTSTNLL